MKDTKMTTQKSKLSFKAQCKKVYKDVYALFYTITRSAGWKDLDCMRKQQLSNWLLSAAQKEIRAKYHKR